jgi:hypothetical protein
MGLPPKSTFPHPHCRGRISLERTQVRTEPIPLTRKFLCTALPFVLNTPTQWPFPLPYHKASMLKVHFKLLFAHPTMIYHGIGLPLYLASAMFVRHTLNALYADLSVELCTHRRWSPSHAPSQHYPRELRMSFGLLVTGRARVTGQLAEWQVYVNTLFLI